MSDLNKRDQVKACIEKGTMTKAQIAEELEMSTGSVSTQMTYLRWMDNYIIADPDTKVLSFTDKETYERLEAEKKANRKTKATTSTRSPEERAAAVAKTLANQTAQLEKWEEKVSTCEEVVEEFPEDEDAKNNLKEAIAMVSLLEVKIARNEKLAADLPDAPEETEETTDTEELL